VIHETLLLLGDFAYWLPFFLAGDSGGREKHSSSKTEGRRTRSAGTDEQGREGGPSRSA